MRAKTTTLIKSLQPLIAMLRHKKLLLVAFCIAAGLIGFGIVNFGMRYSKTVGSDSPPSPDQTITDDVAKPSEKAVSANGFSVPADQPKMIHLPSLGVSGPIQRIGLNKKNAISVPTNVNFAGWYTGSDKPGDRGLSIIDGHVSGEYSPGIFKKLSTLKAGDSFQVEYGDGSKRSFTVVEGRAFAEKDASAYLLEKRADIERQLNLITCDGAFDSKTQQYEKRFVVVARGER